MRKRLFVTIMAVVCMALPALASAIGEWKAYMAYHDVQDVEQAGNVIYVLASNNLYAYNTADNSVQTFSKADVLHDCEITHIKYCAAARRLIIIYSNYNIDLLADDGETVILTDYQASTMTVDKQVNDIYISGTHAYISTGFGIVKLNVRDAEISDTYNLGFPVNHCYIEGDAIYAASARQGLYQAPLTANLVDKGQWSRAGAYVAKTAEDKSALREAIAHVNPGGPRYNDFFQIKFEHDRLYACGGAYLSGALFLDNPSEVQIMRDGEWSCTQDDVAAITGRVFRNTNCIAVDPNDADHIFIGNQSGVYEFQDGDFVNYFGMDNSPLMAVIDRGNQLGSDYVIIDGLAFDREGTLWILNGQTTHNSILAYKDGEFTDHHKEELMLADGSNSMVLLMQAMVDKDNKLWFVNYHWNESSFFCYDIANDQLTAYKGSIQNQNGESVSGYFSCIAEDQEGNMWLGTTTGLYYLSPSQRDNTSPVTLTQVIVPRNDGSNLGDYLLSGVNISAIVVDAANRKWIGTRGNGLYLIDSDNMTEVHHFTESNSVLLSDIITSLAIDNSTGELYIGTEKGLCSYQSEAVAPSDEMTKDNVYAYPNPVRPEYSGKITITGLTLDADVRITASNGRLVAKGRSTAGTFQWDGCDLNGKPVASGIYMVQTATRNGDKGTVCKIAIVR